MSEYTSYTLTVDSKDRNWLAGDTNFNFNFKLENNSTNNRLGVLEKSYKNITSININTIIIPNFFINIDDIHCAKGLGLLLNYNGELASKNINFPRLSDLKYIIVKIDEYNSNINGTNNILNNSSGIFIVDYSLPKTYNNSIDNAYGLNADNNIERYTSSNLLNVGESHLKNVILDNLVLKNISVSKEFIKTKDSLSNFNFTFYKPDGTELKLKNDKLTLSSIISTYKTTTGTSCTTTKDINIITSSYSIRNGLFINNTHTDFFKLNTYCIEKITDTTFKLNNVSIKTGTVTSDFTFESRKLEIKVEEYFSNEEYRIGDRILFKNVNIGTNHQLKDFLEREEGHIIISLYNSDSSNLVITNPDYYNVIEILPQINIINGIISYDYFNTKGDNTDINKYINFTSGNIINLDNQILLNLEIMCKI
jgi:hypothetical protein